MVEPKLPSHQGFWRILNAHIHLAWRLHQVRTFEAEKVAKFTKKHLWKRLGTREQGLETALRREYEEQETVTTLGWPHTGQEFIKMRLLLAREPQHDSG